MCHTGGSRLYGRLPPSPRANGGRTGTACLPDWPDGLEIHRRYNEVIHACAARRSSVRLVPVHAAFLGHGTHCTQFWRKHYRREDPTYWYFGNLEDPNDRGYDALRRLFLIEIAKAAERIGTTKRGD